MTHYFGYLPNVRVRVSSFRKNNVEPFIAAKNIFRRVKIREQIQDDILGFEQYTVGNNERPDQVATELYDDPELDWVILLCNNVINLYNDWPMSEAELYSYVASRYKNVNGVHHHETYEVKDDLGNVLMEAGKVVNSTFQYVTSDNITVVPSVYPVSNYDHERALNDEKSNIWVLRQEYIDDFVDEFEELLQYAPNEELGDGEDIKMTTDAVEEIFIDKKLIYSTEYGLAPSLSFAGQQELTNRTITTTTLDSGATVTQSSTSTSTNTGSGLVNSSGVIAGTTDASSTSQSGSSSSSSSSSGSSSSGSSGSSGGY
jgi:uncharacterized membrane protein YgcG